MNESSQGGRTAASPDGCFVWIRKRDPLPWLTLYCIHPARQPHSPGKGGDLSRQEAEQVQRTWRRNMLDVFEKKDWCVWSIACNGEQRMRKIRSYSWGWVTWSLECCGKTVLFVFYVQSEVVGGRDIWFTICSSFYFLALMGKSVLTFFSGIWLGETFLVSRLVFPRVGDFSEDWKILRQHFQAQQLGPRRTSTLLWNAFWHALLLILKVKKFSASS